MRRCLSLEATAHFYISAFVSMLRGKKFLYPHGPDCVQNTYVLQGSFLIAVTLFQSLGKANKATWLVLFRQIILFIPLCVLLPMIGGLGIRGVWLAIALTDAVLVVITIAMMASEFRKMPPTSQTLR